MYWAVLMPQRRIDAGDLGDDQAGGRLCVFGVAVDDRIRDEAISSGIVPIGGRTMRFFSSSVPILPGEVRIGNKSDIKFSFLVNVIHIVASIIRVCANFINMKVN